MNRFVFRTFQVFSHGASHFFSIYSALKFSGAMSELAFFAIHSCIFHTFHTTRDSMGTSWAPCSAQKLLRNSYSLVIWLEIISSHYYSHWTPKYVWLTSDTPTQHLGPLSKLLFSFFHFLLVHFTASWWFWLVGLATESYSSYRVANEQLISTMTTWLTD